MGLCLLAILCERFASNRLRRVVALLASEGPWLVVSLGILACFCGALVLSTRYRGYLDHVEPNIVSVGRLLMLGRPVYPGVADGERYALLYGPFVYLIYGLATSVGSSLSLAAKVAVVLANLVTMSCCWLSWHRTLGGKKATIALGLTILLLHWSWDPFLYLVRGDVLLVAAVSLGLLGVTRKSPWAASTCLVVGCALAVGLKVSGCLYFAPLFVRYWQARGAKATLLAGCLALALSGAPFLLPNVSLSNYVGWLRAAAHHPLSKPDLMGCLKLWPVLILPPFLLLPFATQPKAQLLAVWREHGSPLLALLGAGAAVTVLSAKLGAGAHHLLPFVPLLVFEYAAMFRAFPAAELALPIQVVRLAAWLGFTLFAGSHVALPMTRYVKDWVALQPLAAAAEQEVLRVASSLAPARVEIGYGVDESLSYFQPLLVEKNAHLTVDEAALADMQLAGLPLPLSTIAELASCRTEAWLVPKGQPPFALTNPYGELAPKLFSPRPLFDAAFRETFAAFHTKIGSSKYFDIWRCKKPVTEPSAPPPARRLLTGGSRGR